MKTFKQNLKNTELKCDLSQHTEAHRALSVHQFQNYDKPVLLALRPLDMVS